MLQQLHIENYALIDRLSVELGPGLNLLTGETGSGKSIVVDAVAILLGGRTSPDVVRAGADRAVLSGVFRVAEAGARTSRSAFSAGAARGQTSKPALPGLRAVAESIGLDLEEGEVLIRREVQANGRTRVFLNDRPATLAAVRDLAPWLADIHGQNEHQALFEPRAQLELLDRFTGVEELAEQVAEAHRAWRAACARLSELTHNEQEKLRLADLWSFQKQEIEAAAPTASEDEQLADEKRVLANSTRIHGLVQSAYEQIFDGAEPAVAALAAALRSLEEVARLDRTLEPVCDSLRAARIASEDSALSLRDYLARLDANPERLENVEERLAVLDRLKRKYGPTLADVVAHQGRVTRQLEELESSDELARQAQQRLQAAAERYRQLAGELSSRRKSAAARLEKAIARILAELAMEKTALRIEFESSTEPHPEQVPIEPRPTEPPPTEPRLKHAAGFAAGEKERFPVPTEPRPTEPPPTEPRPTEPRLKQGAGFAPCEKERFPDQTEPRSRKAGQAAEFAADEKERFPDGSPPNAASDSQSQWTATGIDRLCFLISPNPGEPLRLIEQVASGGELSRIMLAMKTAVEAAREREMGAARHGDAETARTLVFDEIDAGIGGRVAEIVGRKLKALAANHQVLCVTHLAQIACFADQHFYIEKMERQGRTITLARQLEDNERAPELARMIGGARVTDTALNHGRELLRSAKAPGE